METIRAAKAKVPEALAKQKKKFLIALSKDGSKNDWSKEDDDFVKTVMHESNPFQALFSDPSSLFWDDTQATDQVKNKIKQNATFILDTYLECAKTIFQGYSEFRILEVNAVNKCLDYILTHARQFGDPTKPIFKIDDFVSQCNEASPALHEHTRNISTSSLPSSKFLNKYNGLINDLKNSYDERKFIMLNVNVTYIALLIFRRLVKNESEFQASMKSIQTHDNYVKLCPLPLDNLLPKSDMKHLIQSRVNKQCAYLVIHAYLNVADEKTKRVLKVTCVQHMEWCGLQLPHLFFKVVQIYQIEPGQLWDLLCKENSLSFVRLADYYYKQYEMMKIDPLKTQNWFPYCRALNHSYHGDLSAKYNEQICYILAYLVDFKIGFDKSNIRYSQWARSIEKYCWAPSLRQKARLIFLHEEAGMSKLLTLS